MKVNEAVGGIAAVEGVGGVDQDLAVPGWQHTQRVLHPGPGQREQHDGILDDFMRRSCRRQGPKFGDQGRQAFRPAAIAEDHVVPGIDRLAGKRLGDFPCADDADPHVSPSIVRAACRVA